MASLNPAKARRPRTGQPRPAGRPDALPMALDTGASPGRRPGQGSWILRVLPAGGSRELACGLIMFQDGGGGIGGTKTTVTLYQYRNLRGVRAGQPRADMDGAGTGAGTWFWPSTRASNSSREVSRYRADTKGELWPRIR